MTPARWTELQRKLHPKDLESVQQFAAVLVDDAPFVFVTDGVRCVSVVGPDVSPLARDLIGELYPLATGH